MASNPLRSTVQQASDGATVRDPRSTFNVNFICQRCCQPLKLDSSFCSLDDQMLSELSGAYLTYSDNSSALQIIRPQDIKTVDSEDFGSSRKVIHPLRLTESGNGFMLVGDTPTGGVKESLGHHLQVTSYLFDIMSDQSDVDHPLCEECTDTLLDQMDQQLKIAEDECKEYKDFLEKLEASEEEDDFEALEEELRKLEEKRDSLRAELEAAEREDAELQECVKQQQEELDCLRLEEEHYFREKSTLRRQCLLYEDDIRSLENQLWYAEAHLARLTSTNIFNVTFHIWYNGHFGTINNFRLGRLQAIPVEWNEINSAWGQTVLLLHSLAKRINLTFQRYRLVPYGNHSFLESLEDKSKELPLYGYGGFKFFWDTKFDQAMVAFLDCLQQFKEEVEKCDRGFSLPYRIEKGRLEDRETGHTYSIKIQFNSEEQWTKALKYMLTNLKWGLTWVTTQFASNK